MPAATAEGNFRRKSFTLFELRTGKSLGSDFVTALVEWRFLRKYSRCEVRRDITSRGGGGGGGNAGSSPRR